MQKRLLLSVITCSTLVLAQAACGVLAVGAGGAAGIVGLEERTMGEAVDDTSIWAAIKSQYTQKDVNELLSSVNVEVNEGRVLLTGNVNNPQTRVDAVRLAWEVEGVKEVINEISVSNVGNANSFASDAWITGQIKSKMLLNRDIRSINYSVETVSGVVYLIGIAQDQQELDMVTHIASTVNRVKKVVSYVRLRASKLRKPEAAQ